MKSKKKVLSKKRIRGGRTIHKRRKSSRTRIRSKKYKGGTPGNTPSELRKWYDPRQAAAKYAAFMGKGLALRKLGSYNPQGTDWQPEADDFEIKPEHPDFESFSSIDDRFDKLPGLIGDDDNFALSTLRGVDREQREKLEAQQDSDPALIDMRKMKKEHFHGLGIMGTIAQAMGASKKKKKKKKRKRKRTGKKGKGKKGKGGN